MTTQPPNAPENDHSDAQTITDLRDLVHEWEHDRNRIREALLPKLRAHQWTAHEVASDDLQPGYIAEQAERLLRHNEIQIERLNAEIERLTSRLNPASQPGARELVDAWNGHNDGARMAIASAFISANQLAWDCATSNCTTWHHKIAQLIEQAHANRRIGWAENRGEAFTRHWGAVAGFLRRQLPADHPLAYKTGETDTEDDGE